MHKCNLCQVSDQKTCLHCSATWDMNDPVPPQCPFDGFYIEKKSPVMTFIWTIVWCFTLTVSLITCEAKVTACDASVYERCEPFPFGLGDEDE